ncbi:MAG: anti-sigma factor, partial [Acidobacteriota bacterium]
RLRRQGDAFVPRQEHTGPLPDNVTPMRRGSAVETPAQQSAPQPAPERTSGGSNWIPWLLAAAGIGAAVFGWRPIQEPPVQLDGPPVVASVEQRRAVFVDAASDLLSLPWTATEDPAASGAGGDVVWSPERQQGFMRFTGLEVNDPGEFQYQLWIFDGTRDDRYPIDGGVFDVTTSGEVVVPIDAKLNVRQPALFAVTIEAPGGVVVSGRDRIVTLAQVG